MKNLLILSCALLLFGFGCTSVDPNVKTYKDTTIGYSFEYPAANWSVDFKYAEPGAKIKVDDGIPQAMFGTSSIVLFHPVKDAQSVEDAALLISNLKYPGSKVVTQRAVARPELIEVTTKKGTVEYDWLVLTLKKNGGYVVLEVSDSFKSPYPEGLEAGVEMIINTVKEI